MKSDGISHKLIKILQKIYQNATAVVMVNGELSEWFSITVCNRQGDPISPSAFLIVLERTMDAGKDLAERESNPWKRSIQLNVC